MESEPLGRPPGQAFISYVREDTERVNRLVQLLIDAGIRVWRDTESLWPGQDWKIQIREAITSGTLAFVACFSDSSERRETTYQNEEMILAAEQMRLRLPGRSWIIPVRFSDCAIPEYDLGAGRTLRNLQCVDLFDGVWEPKSTRLVSAIVAILSAGSSAPLAPVELRSVPPLKAPERSGGADRDSASNNAAAKDLIDAGRRPAWTEPQRPSRRAPMLLAALAAPVIISLFAVLVVFTHPSALVLDYSWLAGEADLDARPYMTSSNNTGLQSNGSAVFTVSVPSQRKHRLSVHFSASPSPGHVDNCTNGATLTLMQTYGATKLILDENKPIDMDYDVPVPVDVAQFKLEVIFSPQPGFTVCTDDLTVVSAYFHN